MSREIQLTKGMVAIVDEEDYERVAKFKWYFHSKGYAARSVHNGGRRYAQFMHRLIMGNPIGLEVDHKEPSRKLDNRRSNLRVSTSAQNKWNTPTPKHNTSGCKGVSWSKPCGKWRAYITVGSKQIHLGVFDAKEEAMAARKCAANEMHGEFARA